MLTQPIQRKRGGANLVEPIFKIHVQRALTTHESLEVMNDAKEESVVIQPESGQKLVSQFFHFLASGELDRCLAGFAPAAQAHLINEVEALKSLLEEFVSKYKPIKITPIR